MKLLLGGVPLGCDNIGDEAIIACVVKLIRSLVNDADITVCTRDQKGTADRLAVQTAPLYGFPPTPELQQFSQFVKGFDAYIWFGATGLSDYPDTALPLLAAAQNAGVKTIVWCVGMDDELNPAFFKVHGKKLCLLKFASMLSFCLFDAVGHYESRLVAGARRRIASALANCRLVSVRDPESAEELLKCGVKNVVTSADTAILQDTADSLPLPDIQGVRRIGFCISAQREMKQREQILALWKRLLDIPDTRLVLIPMNPKTDKALMLGLAEELPQKDRIERLDNDDPAVVQACASQCCVVISSRLHLLILASNVHTPVIGIERGSKIRNWLKNFGDTPAGTVYDCDFNGIFSRVQAILGTPREQLRKQIEQTMKRLHSRLKTAAQALKNALENSRKL